MDDSGTSPSTGFSDTAERWGLDETITPDKFKTLFKIYSHRAVKLVNVAMRGPAARTNIATSNMAVATALNANLIRKKDPLEWALHALCHLSRPFADVAEGIGDLFLVNERFFVEDPSPDGRRQLHLRKILYTFAERLAPRIARGDIYGVRRVIDTFLPTFWAGGCASYPRERYREIGFTDDEITNLILWEDK
jgi:hypothetical protein